MDDFEGRKVIFRRTTVREFDLRISVNRVTHDDEIEVMEFEGDSAYDDAVSWCRDHNYEITKDV